MWARKTIPESQAIWKHCSATHLKTSRLYRIVLSTSKTDPSPVRIAVSPFWDTKGIWRTADTRSCHPRVGNLFVLPFLPVFNSNSSWHEVQKDEIMGEPRNEHPDVCTVYLLIYSVCHDMLSECMNHVRIWRILIRYIQICFPNAVAWNMNCCHCGHHSATEDNLKLTTLLPFPLPSQWCQRKMVEFKQRLLRKQDGYSIWKITESMESSNVYIYIIIYRATRTYPRIEFMMNAQISTKTTTYVP